MNEHEKDFEKLIARCLSGVATKQETDLVEKWLEDRKEKDPFGSLSGDEKTKIGDHIFQRLSAGIAESAGTKTKASLRQIVLFRAAAAITLLAALTYTLAKFASPAPSPSPVKEMTMVQSRLSSDESKKVILSDNSIVWLKGNSSIHYPEKFEGKERNVALTGEALFEIAKDPDHPFVIQCGGLTARVLGTSFNIKSRETGVVVLVLTGEVELSATGNSEALIVLPNEKAVYNEAQNEISKVVAEKNEKRIKVAGTEYIMRFHATPMKEIINRIEEKFDVRVSLGDERLGNCTITADFTGLSLDRTMHMISQTLKIKYEISDRVVTLNGTGCD